MASEPVDSSDEVLDQIKGYINDGKSFILQGGAGSGKTYLLVETLNNIFDKKPRAHVACVTFTKVAVNEIKERCAFDNLDVSTIHNFLWDSIRSYKNDLKSAVVELIKSAGEGGEGITYKGDKVLDLEYFEGIPISYEEWVDLEKGIISHDEILKVATYMFKKHTILGKILADKFDYILVDEYQDTEKQVIEILLEYTPSDLAIGFFGDSMQAIYDKGVGSLSDYIEQNDIEELVRDGNRRCSVKVIDLINKIRLDGLQQIPVNDNVEGSVKFLYSSDPNVMIEDIRQHPVFQEWNFGNAKETKELYLTHNLISKHARYDNLFQIYDKDPIIAHVRLLRHTVKDNPTLEANVGGKTFGEVLDQGLKSTGAPFNQFVTDNPELYQWSRSLQFSDLMKMYVDKDQLVEGGSEKKENRGDKKDDLIKHLTKIQSCVYLYTSGNINEFSELTDFAIRSVSDKARLKELMEELRAATQLTVGEVIDKADQSGIVKKDDRFNNFVKRSEYLYRRVSEVPYDEFIHLYDTEKGNNPFSTQHSVKGAEYENVFIVLDNGRWNQYNFRSLFEDAGTASVIERTRKMFYVCCSRARNNLVVYFPEPTQAVLAKAKDWFGNDNVLDVTDTPNENTDSRRG